MQARRFLFLEPDIEGHPREWLQYLLRFAIADARRSMVWFIVAAELHAELASELPREAEERVRLVPLRAWEHRLCTHRLLSINAFARWWTMRRYLRLTGAEIGHFLMFDQLALPLALGLRAGGKSVSGILFRPSVHYRSLGRYRPRFGERVRDWRKALLYRLMLRNPSVGLVLTLDPYFPNYAARHYRCGDRIRSVPDPAHPPVNHTSEDARLAESMPVDRVKFLLFGFLTARKGVLVLLEALRLLPRDSAQRIAVVLAGNIDPGIRNTVLAQCRSLAAERPELWLHVENRWLARGELDCMVKGCDVVLAPYQRFVGSSGVLLWAARAGRPVLTQDFGLIGRLVADHRLGLAIDAADPHALSQAMVQMARHGSRSFFDASAAAAFVTDRMPKHFASAIFSSLFEMSDAT
ncbi:MAG TPA: glycosyltransferase [Alphaproteobacteria bacterium]|nr:glycosyltransferase [Alphaproteobacteria bacterium]